MNLQGRYELAKAERDIGPKIKAEVEHAAWCDHTVSKSEIALLFLCYISQLKIYCFGFANIL